MQVAPPFCPSHRTANLIGKAALKNNSIADLWYSPLKSLQLRTWLRVATGRRQNRWSATENTPDAQAGNLLPKRSRDEDRHFKGQCLSWSRPRTGLIFLVRRR